LVRSTHLDGENSASQKGLAGQAVQAGHKIGHVSTHRGGEVTLFTGSKFWGVPPGRRAARKKGVRETVRTQWRIPRHHVTQSEQSSSSPCASRDRHQHIDACAAAAELEKCPASVWDHGRSAPKGGKADPLTLSGHKKNERGDPTFGLTFDARRLEDRVASDRRSAGTRDEPFLNISRSKSI